MSSFASPLSSGPETSVTELPNLEIADGVVVERNYDILGKDPVPPSGKTFQIRETRNDLIQAGRFSTLGRSRENVHDLVAGPDGARVLDVFTYFERGARSYYLAVDDKPRDEARRIYDAAWR